MANIKSAKKRIKLIAKRTERNMAIRTRVKTAIKKFEAAVASEGADLQKELASAMSIIDKAAAKGVLHKNAAARRKARLARLLAQREAQGVAE